MMKRRRGLLLLGLAAVLAVSGCVSVDPGATGELRMAGDATQLESATTTTAGSVVREPEAPSVPLGEATDAEPPPADDPYPVRVRIPDVGVDADVIDLGLNTDGTLEVPDDFDQTGWYTGRSVPGNIGPSVVVGHVDSTSGPAVFYRLRDLEPGHTIEIHRSDGLVALFRVSDTALVAKDKFPTEQVYGATAEPTLRLVTCGGDFDRSVRSYKGNFIVFAQHVVNYEPIPDSQRS